jgi:multiple sugar transport system ATP-binding protein
MASVRLRGIRKQYGDNPVIKGVDLDIEDGQFVVFVGPSGCGKSTLLRMIAGLEDISAGTLELGGVVSNAVEPAQRGIAMVFQSYALYPHMTVADNMGFALKLAKVAKEEIRERVTRAAEILQIAHLLERKPKALSGGQRQRVAIGRAIVRKPEVFLFDEPLSNLDAALRAQTRVELARLHRELNATMIYVTHDQVEAMTLGQKIVVFNAGRIEQAGTPLELYERPANLFVAGFLGSPRMNFMPASLVGEEGRLAIVRLAGGATVEVAAEVAHAQVGAGMTLGVRPEHLRLGPAPAPVSAPASSTTAGASAEVDRERRRDGRREGIQGTLALVEYLGDVLLAYVQVAGVDGMVAVKCNHSGHGGPALPALGSVVSLGFDPRQAYLFDEGGKALVGGHAIVAPQA